jgi:hypothetical protein
VMKGQESNIVVRGQVSQNMIRFYTVAANERKRKSNRAKEYAKAWANLSAGDRLFRKHG